MAEILLLLVGAAVGALLLRRLTAAAEAAEAEFGAGEPPRDLASDEPPR